MRKVVPLICFLVISASWIMGDVSHAQMRSDSGMSDIMMPSGKWWRMPNMVKKLHLKPNEQQQLDRLFVENRRKLIGFKGNLEKEKFELEVIFDKKTFDESACMRQFKRIEAVRTNLATERFRFALEVRKLLGHDRFQTLKENYDRRMNRARGKERRRLPKERSLPKEGPQRKRKSLKEMAPDN